MCTTALLLVCITLMFGSSLSCYQCFIDHQDSGRLCNGYFLTKYDVRNVDTCFRTLDRIFNNHKGVIEAGRVGAVNYLLFIILLMLLDFFSLKGSPNNSTSK